MQWCSCILCSGFPLLVAALLFIVYGVRCLWHVTLSGGKLVGYKPGIYPQKLKPLSNQSLPFISHFEQISSLRSFSIQLQFPRGQKIPPDFRTEHAQSWHLKNRKMIREKKSWEFSTFLADSREKNINQSNLS